MKKNYEYNYAFLEEWRVENGKSKKELMDVIGADSRNNLNEWLGVSKAQREARERGEHPDLKSLKLGHIISLCNYYGIDIGNFFLLDGKPCVQQEHEKPKRVQKDTPNDKKLLEMKVRYYEDIEKARLEIKSDYEKRLNDANSEVLRQRDELERKSAKIDNLQNTIEGHLQKIEQQGCEIISLKEQMLAFHGKHLTFKGEKRHSNTTGNATSQETA